MLRVVVWGMGEGDQRVLEVGVVIVAKVAVGSYFL